MRPRSRRRGRSFVPEILLDDVGNHDPSPVWFAPGSEAPRSSRARTVFPAPPPRSLGFRNVGSKARILEVHQQLGLVVALVHDDRGATHEPRFVVRTRRSGGRIVIIVVLVVFLEGREDVLTCLLQAPCRRGRIRRAISAGNLAFRVRQLGKARSLRDCTKTCATSRLERCRFQ